MIDLPLWAAIIGYVLGIAGAFGGALAVARSKYRAKADEERETYIKAMEARNKLLEDTNERQAQEMRSQEHQLHELKGQVQLLSQLVMGRCAWADLDPETSKCRHCDRSKIFAGEAL